MLYGSRLNSAVIKKENMSISAIQKELFEVLQNTED